MTDKDRRDTGPLDDRTAQLGSSKSQLLCEGVLSLEIFPSEHEGKGTEHAWDYPDCNFGLILHRSCSHAPTKSGAKGRSVSTARIASRHQPSTMAPGDIGGEPHVSNAAESQENDNDEKDQSQASGRVITPVFAVRPSW